MLYLHLGHLHNYNQDYIVRTIKNNTKKRRQRIEIECLRTAHHVDYTGHRPLRNITIERFCFIKRCSNHSITCGCLDATSGPIVLHGMLGAAAGSMPSFMLEPISDSMQFMIKAIGRDTMGMWLTVRLARENYVDLRIL